MSRIIKRQIQILQHLRKEETLRIIHPSPKSRRIIHISNTRKRAINTQEFLKTINRASRMVEVFRISRNSEGIEIGFEDFGTEDVVGSSDVESVLGVES